MVFDHIFYLVPDKNLCSILSAGTVNYENTLKFMEKYSTFEQWGTPEIKQRALDLANEAYQVIWEFNPPMLEPKP
jgi:selenocysteine lyase/cysteine desulfurase